MSRSRSVSRDSTSPGTPDLQSKRNEETSPNAVVTKKRIQPQKTVPETSPNPIRKLYRKLKLAMEDNPNEKADGTITEEEEIVDGDFNIAVLAREDGEPYGCFGWAPSFLQCCRQYSVGFLLVLCALSIAASFIQHGAILASNSMWQRRFHFTTTDLASIRAMYDLGALIMLVPIIFFDVQGVHRPQVIGLGGVVVGMGAMFIVVPHFADEGGHRYSAHHNQGLCGSQASPKCEHLENYGLYKALFMIGELLIGMGVSSYWTLGITYLDENISHRQSTLYTAIVDMCHMIGPVLGFVTAGQTEQTYGDIDKWNPPNEHHSPEHHDWYGAWWIAIIIGGGMSWIGAAFMFPFPAQLSGAVLDRINDVCEGTTNQQDAKVLESEIRGCMRKLKSILGNRVFLGVMLEECFRNCIVVGVSTFLGRYLEAAFTTTTKDANMAIGVMITLTALTALFFGATIQFWFRLDVFGNLLLCLVSTVATVIFVTTFFVHCPDLKFVGDGNGTSINLTSNCNQNCTCQLDHFEPICFTPFENNTASKKRTGTTYFSKCSAGCFENPVGKANPNCSCFKQPGNVTARPCPTGCGKGRMYAFLIGLGWTAASLYIRFNCVKQIQLRSVQFNHRTVGIALSEIMNRVINIPSPFVFSHILGTACKKRTAACGDEKTVCAIYDRLQMAGYLVAAIISFSILCSAALGFALYSYRQQEKQKQLCNSPRTAKSSVSTAKRSKKGLKKESGSSSTDSTPQKVSKKTTIDGKSGKSTRGKLQPK